MNSTLKNQTNPEVILFTDGACSGNPGPGGWGFILRHVPTGKEKISSGAEPDTTNNRMEMSAVIEGLKCLTRPVYVELVSDSSYVGNGLSKWLPGWKRAGWKLKDGKPIKNLDLWQEMDQLMQIHRIKYTYVKGHAGHPENEKCDQLAVEAYKKLKRGR